MIPEKYRKRSFIKFNIPIDIETLRAELNSIPESDWSASYWGNIHCSVGTLLLRGGNQGDPADYYSDDVFDHPLLASLPAIRSILTPDGPFGGAIYAFLFRMEPNGLTMAHCDEAPKWRDMYRVHIPLFTSDDARLISDGRAIHFAPGHAWSFDNQSQHGFVNGNIERVHLIFDVPFNDTMASQIANAQIVPGTDATDLMKIISTPSQKQKASYPGDPYIRAAVAKLRQRGKDNQAIADVLNAKAIPTKHYATNGQHADSNLWSAELIEQFTE